MIRQTRPSYTPTVQELRAVVYSAELGTASGAAEALNLTQGAVSRSIRTLEERLGVRLFHRERQRLILSDAGRALVRDARDILDRLESSARMVMAFGGGEDVLRLAVLPTFATTWLIPRLAGFATRHPGIGLDLGEALGPVDFDDSPFDAALQRVEMARPGTRVLPICDERLIVVAAPALVGHDPIAPAELLEYPLIQQSTRPELWSDWLAAAGVDLFRQLRGPRFQHFGMVLAAAQAGLGVALLPDIFAAQAIAAGSLRQPCPQVLAGRSPYALIRPAATNRQRSLELFADWLHETVATDEGKGDGTASPA